MKISLLKKSVLFLIILAAGAAYSQQLAFPTAEGGGKYTTGGRGGKVNEVTNLKDSGPGSLRAAVTGDEKKTVVFRVSGTIILNDGLDIGANTTVAGQTAPGDGITIRKFPIFLIGDNIILRYIRVRLGDENGKAVDAITAREFKPLENGEKGYQFFNMNGWNSVPGTNKPEHTNMILDHVSTSWSLDECLSIYHCPDVTIQWCTITESLNANNHGFGAIWGGRNNSYHHNLIAHHVSRNVRFCGGTENCDYRNNVCYNWGRNTIYGGEDKQNFSDRWTFSSINLVGNTYKKGPNGGVDHMASCDGGSWYIKDNAGVTKTSGGKRLNEPVKVTPIRTQSAGDAYKAVLEHVGCSIVRDAVDKRIIKEVETGTATYGKGIISTQKTVGGWPELKSLPAPADEDHDGMPDSWEKANGLNPKDPEDRNGIGVGGYTNLEVYLNSIPKPDRDILGTLVKKEIKPKGFNLFQINGNKINYSFPKKSAVTLEIFDITGKRAAILVNEMKEAGKYTVDYSGLNLSTGPYVCKISTGNTTFAKNMFLVQ